MKAVAWRLEAVGDYHYPRIFTDEQAVDQQRAYMINHLGRLPNDVTITELYAVNPELVDKLLKLFEAVRSCYGPGDLTRATRLGIGAAHTACVDLVAAHHAATEVGDD